MILRTVSASGWQGACKRFCHGEVACLLRSPLRGQEALALTLVPRNKFHIQKWVEQKVTRARKL